MLGLLVSRNLFVVGSRDTPDNTVDALDWLDLRTGTASGHRTNGTGDVAVARGGWATIVAGVDCMG